jgi:Xaa-Pro aminopeptidase
MVDEAARAHRLLDAQGKAVDLLAEVKSRGLIAPGETERAVSDRIRDLANEMFRVTRFWHKRIVRSGPNTLHPYRSNPPDRVIGEDDIAFVDFGPIFADWEADFGRTFVLGDDPAKHRLRADLPEVFAAGRRVSTGHGASAASTRNCSTSADLVRRLPASHTFGQADVASAMRKPPCSW